MGQDMNGNEITEDSMIMEDVNVKAPEDLLSNLEGKKPELTMDVYQFEGKQVPIEKISIIPLMSKFGKDGKQLPPGQEFFTPVMHIETQALFKGVNKEGKPYELRASENFSLKVTALDYIKLVKGLGHSIDEEMFNAEKAQAQEIINRMVKEKKVIWSEHEKGALFKFMKKMRVTHPSKLKGRLVIINPRPSKTNPDIAYPGFVKE